MCNKQTSHANSDINLEDVKNISCNNNNKHLHKSVLKIKNILQTELIKTSTPIATFKYASNCQQNIKPCSVQLDACTVQSYVLDHEKAVGAKQEIFHDVKFLCTDTSHAKRDISEEHNTILQPTSIGCNNIIESFKHLSIKKCFVALDYIDIVKNQVPKTKKSVNGSVDAKNKSNVSHLIFDDSSAFSNTNSAELVSYNMKRNEEKLIKDSIVKVEKLKVQEFVKKDSIVHEKRERYIISSIPSSTPINKHVKSYVCSTSFSPINDRDTLYPKYKYSITNVEENISNIVLPNQNNSPLIMKCDDVDIHEQLTQILPSSQKVQARDSIVKIKASSSSTSSEEDIHILPTQKNDVVMEASPRSLNILSVADTDPSLFSDYSSKDIEKCKVQKIHSTNMSICDEIAHATDSFIDLSLENITSRKRVNGNANTEDETVNNDKGSFVGEGQDNVNNVLPGRLQDSIKVTGRRTRYSKWLSNQLSNFKSLNDETAESKNKIFHCDVIDEILDIPSETCNFECSTNAKKSPGSAQSHDANKRVKKSVFLKPGKYWARSLSILNHINNESNLDKLSLGKGKKWRHSVKDVLDMQKQGNFTPRVNFCYDKMLKVCINNYVSINVYNL